MLAQPSPKQMQIPGYTLIKKINSGGMATVYLATQHSVGRTLALKVMKPALDIDPEFHQRFKLEANIIGQLSHPNIIPIYDIGRHQSFNYISMEFLANGSLDQKIAQGIQTKDTIKIMIGIAAALEHAHIKGYVHRDIKPENILFRADNSPVLTDFGIARTIKNDTKMTQVGAVIGTPLYMSPEQAKGEASDGRADLYSLGVVFYEMLTGARPFQADCSLELGIKHIHEKAPKLPLQFFFLQPVLDKLLAKKPEHRYHNARELINALEQVKISSAPLLASVDRQTQSLQLLKTMSFLLAQHLWFYTKKLSQALTRLIQHILKRPEKTLIIDDSTPERMEAHTIVSQPVTVADIFNHYRHQPYWIYSAVGVLVLVLLGIVMVSLDSSSAPSASAAAKNKTDLLNLTINATPASARVRILNIKESYHPGIKLAPGAYHVEVSQEGHVTQTNWIDLKSDNAAVNVSLNKKEANLNALPLPDMVSIQAREFLMGNAADTDENAVKKVFLDTNFYISRYEITFNEYDYFAAATNRALPDDNGWGRGNQPVINVSWDDAMSYTNWLSKMTGQHYRLASTAEWEYAARGGTTSSFWWGNNDDDAVDRANCFGCKSLLTSLFSNQTQAVGSYPPNDFGLYDTAGNVAEWVDDCSETHEEKATFLCEHRLIRGGSYSDRIANISVFSETSARPKETKNTVGFRIVRGGEKTQFKKFLKRIFSQAKSHE